MPLDPNKSRNDNSKSTGRIVGGKEGSLSAKKESDSLDALKVFIDVEKIRLDYGKQLTTTISGILIASIAIAGFLYKDNMAFTKAAGVCFGFAIIFLILSTIHGLVICEQRMRRVKSLSIIMLSTDKAADLRKFLDKENGWNIREKVSTVFAMFVLLFGLLFLGFFILTTFKIPPYSEYFNKMFP